MTGFMMHMPVFGPAMRCIIIVVLSLIHQPTITGLINWLPLLQKKIGENPHPYRAEAEKILKALNDRLWLSDKGHWAEYQDFMGHRRLHESAGVMDHLSCTRQ